MLFVINVCHEMWMIRSVNDWISYSWCCGVIEINMYHNMVCYSCKGIIWDKGSIDVSRVDTMLFVDVSRADTVLICWYVMGWHCCYSLMCHGLTLLLLVDVSRADTMIFVVVIEHKFKVAWEFKDIFVRSPKGDLWI